MAEPQRPRKVRVEHLLEVHETVRLTPHLRRLVLGGAGFDALDFKDATDQYIKLLFADPSLGLSRPFGLEALRERLPPQEMPVTRTYTVRRIDRTARQIWVDMVTHGDDGPAGRWAQQARPGDAISFFGPGGAYAPRPEADFHLLAGDESAIPAVAAALEWLERHAPKAVGVALLEVSDAAEEIPLDAPDGIEVRWLHRGGDFAPERARLVRALAELELPDGDVQVFVHGERGEMKKARRLLVSERGLDRKAMSLSAYWAAGRIEDEFQAEKRTPIGRIDED
ncbi:MAG: siderophore-interacting protein [Nesterenkonia sp.]|uniref:siderophore-interacting protein n=1 Tax=Nesterenkonia marinintestina TaxID=2979865 RepID=UPI0021C0E3FF|nr:siderophore-interacting protein [Nesterenkonia sp. GX14115]MDO5493889.1 siderophore-interacting protein [Nesterenkonia sp.]